MRTALLFLALALSSHAAETVGVAWFDTAFRAQTVYQIWHREQTTNAWKLKVKVPSTEVSERMGDTNIFEIAIVLQDGRHEFAVSAGAGKLSESVSCVVGEPPEPVLPAVEYLTLVNLLQEADEPAGPRRDFAAFALQVPTVGGSKKFYFSTSTIVPPAPAQPGLMQTNVSPVVLPPPLPQP